MQVRLIPALLLFLGSYFPLAIILAVQDVKPEYWSLPICRPWIAGATCVLPSLSNPALAATFLCTSSASLTLLLWSLEHFRGTTELTIEESKTIPNDLINYVFPYIVSFMGVELGSPGKVIGFGIFMFWLFLISYRSGQILMNPLLLAVGWQLYEVKADIEANKRQVRALSRERLVPGDVLKSCLVQGIYVLSQKKSQ